MEDSDPRSEIFYRIRVEGVDPNGQDYGDLVARISCKDCKRDVCIAQTAAWPPTGLVTLRIGIGWPEPVINDLGVFCPSCGGPTTTDPGHGETGSGTGTDPAPF